MNLNQILFATDFSDRTLNTFRQSCQLAADWNANLNVVYVRDPRDVVKPTERQIDPKKEFARFEPQDFAVSYDHLLREGDPAPEILQVADEVDADLIVLGTHGRTGLERVFGGSVAEKVLRKAECPVMTLRETDIADKQRPLKRLLAPVDFSVYGYAAVDFATHLALTTHAEVTICYVDESDHSDKLQHANKHQEKIWDDLKKFTPNHKSVIFSHKLLRGNAGEEICKFANAKHFDYVIVGTHGRTGIGRAIMGSVAEFVVRHANCPVISVKPSNKRSKLPTPT